MRRRSALSHSILCPLFITFIFSERALCDDTGTNITWISPSPGDNFGPGDKIVGRWSADNNVVSPSFRLCMPAKGDGSLQARRNDDDDGAKEADTIADTSCGSTVWPIVQQSSGQFYMTLAVPNVTKAATYFLQMEDESGTTMQSPQFSLGPTASAANNIEPSRERAQQHNSTNPAPSNSTLTDTTPPYLAATRMGPPAAAIAVPLSIVGAIILVAGGLAYHHQRSLDKERSLAAARLTALSRQSTCSNSSSLSSAQSSDVEKAAGGRWYGTSERVSERRSEPRRATREAFAARTPLDEYYDRRRHGAATRHRSIADSSRSLRSARDRGGHAHGGGRSLAQEHSGYAGDDDDEATVTESVIADCVLPEKDDRGRKHARLPTPPSLLPTIPQTLHVRNEACEYDVPLSPVQQQQQQRRGRGEGEAGRETWDVYDAVYRAVRSGRA